MNTIPPNAPPQIPLSSFGASDLVPLGSNPEEHEPVSNLVVAIESILRQPRRIFLQLRQAGAGALIGIMLFGALVCSLIYGAVVGSFSMGTQLWAAPLKVAAGLLITAIICLPSLYIFACISGSRAGLREICGLVAGLILLMTLLLVGFAPVAWLFAQSTESVLWMGALHLVFWFIATCFGLRFLTQGFSHSQARSKAGLVTWIAIFVLVAVQMTTALRPLLGKSDTFLPTTKKFFIAHWGDCLNSPQPPAR
ncbi:MAG TPA: hypothetical protein VFE51_01235 [Verrucomicrobiae bacterium]|nr:hypothetical protein [Verrucomicrobiae bacterium]